MLSYFKSFKCLLLQTNTVAEATPSRPNFDYALVPGVHHGKGHGSGQPSMGLTSRVVDISPSRSASILFCELCTRTPLTQLGTTNVVATLILDMTCRAIPV